MSNFTKFHLRQEIFTVLPVFSQFLWNLTFIFLDSHEKCSLVLLQMTNFIFKPEYPKKNLSEQRREPTTNSTYTWRRRRDLNPGHIGGRLAGCKKLGRWNAHTCSLVQLWSGIGLELVGLSALDPLSGQEKWRRLAGGRFGFIALYL